MYESQMILTRGFQNAYNNGQAIGFQILLRTAYYRGVFLDIVGAIEITVDGTKYSGDALRLTVNGRTFTVQEAGRTENVHWDFGAAMIVTVLKPGGLKPGIHEVQVTQGVNPSYVPPNLFRASGHKRMTLVV